MKLVKKIMLLLFLGMFACVGLVGCDDDEATTYSVEKRDFYYSLDNGSTYGNERYELEVGQTILMKVIVCVTTNKEDKEQITGTLSIPLIDALDAYYLRGQKMTPTKDDINNVTSYNFTITTNEEWTFIFEFKPNGAAMVQMDLDFDDPVPSIYDTVNSIKFVNKENAE